jgi:DNA polymerase-3 subunit delta'
MRLLEILDQNTAIANLKRAIATDKVPHAYLFSGPAGVGKRTAARALAMALNCLEKKQDDACGVCSSCLKTIKDCHPDLVTVTLPPKKRTIPVDAVRELEKRLAVRPHEGRALVAIIDPADRMTDSAANAILKTLEEPRPNRFLILVTARFASLLPTVRSRCQIVRFRPLTEQTVSDLLVKNGVEREDAVRAATFSGGSLERALSYLEGDPTRQMDALLTLLESSLDPTPLDGLKVIEGLKSKRESARIEVLAVLELAPTVLLELDWMVTHPEEDAGPRPLLEGEFGDRIRRLASSMSLARIADVAATIHRIGQAIEINNMNPQLAMEDMLFSIRGQAGDVSAEGRFGGK